MNRSFSRKNKTKGFGLVETLIVLAILGGMLAIMLNRSDRADTIGAANELAEDLPVMVSKVKGLAGPSKSYAAVTPANLSKWAVLPDKLVWDGSNLKDPYGNNMTVNGSATTFAITIGGTTNPIDKEVCSAVASKLAGGAMTVRVGTAATAAAGVVSSGYAYKEIGGTPDAAVLATGCAEATPVIAFQFR